MSTQVKRNPVDREKSILEGVRRELGTLFVREVDGVAVHCWYRRLMDCRGLSAGTAVRHFNVIHHMIGESVHTLVEGDWHRLSALKISLDQKDSSSGYARN
jgi:hypothetical protein